MKHVGRISLEPCRVSAPSSRGGVPLALIRGWPQGAGIHVISNSCIPVAARASLFAYGVDQCELGATLRDRACPSSARVVTPTSITRRPSPPIESGDPQDAHHAIYGSRGSNASSSSRLGTPARRSVLTSKPATACIRSPRGFRYWRPGLHDDRQRVSVNAGSPPLHAAQIAAAPTFDYQNMILQSHRDTKRHLSRARTRLRYRLARIIRMSTDSDQLEVHAVWWPRTSPSDVTVVSALAPR